MRTIVIFLVFSILGVTLRAQQPPPEPGQQAPSADAAAQPDGQTAQPAAQQEPQALPADPASPQQPAQPTPAAGAPDPQAAQGQAQADQAPAGQAQPQGQATPTPSGGISFRNFRGASLFEVIDILARQLEINYILDPSVSDGTVTINTYGTLEREDLFPLFETILRINGVVAVKVGSLYRIVPADGATRLPISPQVDARDNLPNDERMVLNAIRLRYTLATDLVDVLEPFLGEGAKSMVVSQANVLIVLDNSRNMRRTMELIELFDTEQMAEQGIRLIEVKNGLATTLAAELTSIFSAFSVDQQQSPVRFVPLQRINTILAVSANERMFEEVNKWVEKLDKPITIGGIQNFIYRVQYGLAGDLASTILSLYGFGFGGGYGGGGYGGGGYGGGGYGGGGYGGGGYGGGGYGGGRLRWRRLRWRRLRWRRLRWRRLRWRRLRWWLRRSWFAWRDDSASRADRVWARDSSRAGGGRLNGSDGRLARRGSRRWGGSNRARDTHRPRYQEQPHRRAVDRSGVGSHPSDPGTA